MANYQLDMTKAHKQSFIELVNHDNAATIETPLTLSNTLIRDERVVAGAEGVAREFAVTLENAAYAADTVEVFFNKVQLADVMGMTEADNDFDWYTPDDWEDATSIPAAIEAFKVAAIRAGIDPVAAMESVAVTRHKNETENRYYLDFTLTSMVFHGTVSFMMPKHFSEVIKVKALNGFVFTPIAPEDVVA